MTGKERYSMKSRFFIPEQVIFLVCTFISSLDYAFGIGRWKDYVQLFGWLELFLTAAGAVMLTVLLLKKGRPDADPVLRGVTFLLWLMQFCPALYALMLGGVYFWYSLFHWACILLGRGLLFQPRAKKMNEIQPN